VAPEVYGIGTHAPDARPEFVAATLDAAREALPDGGGTGFVIAHDAKAAGLALVYWWANENEVHGRFFASPLDTPPRLCRWTERDWPASGRWRSSTSSVVPGSSTP
jgi:hypothetical protein